MIVLWEGCHGAHIGPAVHVLKERIGFGIDHAELLTGARRGVKAAVAWVVPHLIGRWYLGNEGDHVAVQRSDDLEYESGARLPALGSRAYDRSRKRPRVARRCSGDSIGPSPI